MRPGKVLAAFGVVVVIAATSRYLLVRSRSRLPAPDSPVYEETTQSFYRGLAQLQVGLLDDAKREFTKTTELVSSEPAGWANLGLAHLRLGEFDAAAAPIERAVRLAPRSSDVVFLQGRLETSRGKLDEGLAHYRRAVELDAGNMRARYALAEEIERAGGPNADAEAQREFEEILKARPGNLAVLLERARLSAKRSDAIALDDSVRILNQYVAAWPAPAVEQYRALQAAAASRNFQDAARDVAFLRNVLVRATVFRESLAAVRTPTELIAEPFERFLVLASPSSKPSAADDGLRFRKQIVGSRAVSAFSTILDESGDSTIVTIEDRGLRLDRPARARVPSLPGGPDTLPAWQAIPVANIDGISRVLPLDWNRDFKMDLAVAARGGLRLLTQQANGSFADATAKMGSPINVDCFGVWTADIEMDGDLDLIVGIRGAEPVVLRNNGDGTARQLKPFSGVVGLRGFAWGDLDGDGDPDAALLDERGVVHLFENRQGGEFREMAAPAGVGTTVALTIGDANGDGVLDLVTLDSTGAIHRFSRKSDAWNAQSLPTWPDRIDAEAIGAYRLVLADMDNNGALDLVVSGAGQTRIWLAGTSGDFGGSPDHLDADVFSVADMNGDGLLDLVGVADGQAVQLEVSGTKGYHWQVTRPKAQPTAGDQRINSFGVGGEIDIRSGLLTQRQLLIGQPAHFGLGSRTSIDVARIFWPNGIMQADFDSKADQSIVAEQRLKGSCPWVFTYDGAGMRFVTDFLWRSPLGLRINAQDTAGVTQTEDWVKIRGDQLVARDGAYDVRITAELWETHFVDHVSLLVVDHPRDEEVFVDERFAREAPALAVHAVRNVHPVARAWDQAGRDVTEVVSARDGRYLSTFARGPYQGIAQDHFVEMDLGEDIRGDVVAPALQAKWLIATGWIYPTDSSINVAIGQAGIQPRGLSLEAQNEAGRWVVVAADLGFPAGKNKTILIDLEKIGRAGIAHARRVRLRTNLEIYWDSLAIADAAANDTVETTRVQAAHADLRYRGFSKTDFARHDVPETPKYGELANVGQRWRDLTGYYTRYGDVAELLSSVDDRYVIMNAGDEIRLTFSEPVSPKADRRWARDYVLIGDGWVKDGDYNTTFSKTVEPLPRHGHPNYEAAPPTPNIEDDPAYRAHADDWQRYHTRFVAPDRFLSGLR
jgi:tetratricopeptide (TPR) repeat protein